MARNDDHFSRHHFFHLVRELARCEFRLRDQSTLLGFLWTLLHPLLLFVVLYALFVKWMGNHVESFPLYLMIGVVQWNYFAKGTAGGLGSIMQKASLVSNFIFPRSALVVSSVLTNLLIHLLEWAVMIPFLLLLGASVSFKWLLLPIPLLLETALILGLSFFLARLAVDYKDVARIWEIVITTGMFVTPIFYTTDVIAPDRRQILLLNPLALLIGETRKFLIYDRMPSWKILAVLTLAAALLLAVGYRYFRRGEPHFAEKFP